jgi:hypothetical protein
MRTNGYPGPGEADFLLPRMHGENVTEVTFKGIRTVPPPAVCPLFG